jgi:hypothetical protein
MMLPLVMSWFNLCACGLALFIGTKIHRYQVEARSVDPELWAAHVNHDDLVRFYLESQQALVGLLHACGLINGFCAVLGLTNLVFIFTLLWRPASRFNQRAE